MFFVSLQDEKGVPITKKSDVEARIIAAFGISPQVLRVFSFLVEADSFVQSLMSSVECTYFIHVAFRCAPISALEASSRNRSRKHLNDHGLRQLRCRTSPDPTATGSWAVSKRCAGTRMSITCLCSTAALHALLMIGGKVGILRAHAYFFFLLCGLQFHRTIMLLATRARVHVSPGSSPCWHLMSSNFPYWRDVMALGYKSRQPYTMKCMSYAVNLEVRNIVVV